MRGDGGPPPFGRHATEGVFDIAVVAPRGRRPRERIPCVRALRVRPVRTQPPRRAHPGLRAGGGRVWAPQQWAGRICGSRAWWVVRVHPLVSKSTSKGSWSKNSVARVGPSTPPSQFFWRRVQFVKWRMHLGETPETPGTNAPRSVGFDEASADDPRSLLCVTDQERSCQRLRPEGLAGRVVARTGGSHRADTLRALAAELWATSGPKGCAGSRGLKRGKGEERGLRPALNTKPQPWGSAGRRRLTRRRPRRSP